MDLLMAAAREVYATAPALFEPLADFFGVDVAERLNDPKFQERLFYEGY
jgi:hypothetical protein